MEKITLQGGLLKFPISTGSSKKVGGDHFKGKGFLNRSDPCLHYIWLQSLSNVLQTSNMHPDAHKVVKLFFLFGYF